LIRKIKQIDNETIHSKIEKLILTFILSKLTHLIIYLDTAINPSPKEFLLSQINGNCTVMNQIYEKVSNYVKDCSFYSLETITKKISESFRNKNINIRFSLDEANLSAQFLDGV
jgi:hypothetical protein